MMASLLSRGGRGGEEEEKEGVRVSVCACVSVCV